MKRLLIRLRRAVGSVRVRVTGVAAAAFAIALIAGSMLLLHALQSRLVGDIRDADRNVLQGQAFRVLSDGLAVPSGVPTVKPLAGNGTVAFYLDSVGGQSVVATANGEVTTPGPSVEASSATVIASSSQPSVLNTVIDVTATETKKANVVPLDPQSARLLGVADQHGPFLLSSVQVYPGLSLSTASSLAQVNQTLDTTRTILWFVVPGLVLLVAACAWLLVGRALRPVHALTMRAATINSHSLHERVPVPGVGDEITELATTINSMLERIETTTVAGRRLVSDASHELRTPITVMRAELEVARRDPNPEWTTVSANVLVEVERLQQLVDDLLLLARINERGVHSAPFSLLDLVRDTAGRKRRVPVEVGEWTDADNEILGDGPAVARAVDHVVANAARHAETCVVVTIERSDDLVTVHVDDDGPGIPPSDRDRVLRRFERLDEARSRDEGGSGLGLAVAVDVMTAHGGTVDIGESPLDGARVSLVMQTGRASGELGATLAAHGSPAHGSTGGI